MGRAPYRGWSSLVRLTEAPMTGSANRYLACAVFTVGASLGCGVDDADPVGGGCSNDPNVITCEQLLAGQVRGDHPTYTIYYDASPCDQDDIACFEEATGVPLFSLRGYYFSVRSSDLPALCTGPFAPRISSLEANVDHQCYQLGQ